MSWELIAELIVSEGLPLAEKIYQKWASGNPPTQADFDELRALQTQKAADRLKAQLAAAGIPLDDPKAVALLALVK